MLVGPSGCGKSTLLRMIAGLESITSGEVSIGDRVVNGLEPSERDIAMVFQNYALYPHMTVRQNLSYGLKNRNTPKEEIERRIAKAAKSLEIEPFLDRKPRQLSGGQRQRVAMGRAIVREPAAFLFDEPLEPRRQAQGPDARRDQAPSAGARHDERLRHPRPAGSDDARRPPRGSERGRIEQVGTPIELYENPATAFVATFIGSPSMNLLDLNTGNAAWSAPAALVGKPGLATIGIRPEDITLAGDTDGGERFRARVRVGAVELVGAESYVHGTLANGEPLVFRVAGRSRMMIDEEVEVAAVAGSLHWFDAAGRRL